MLIGFGCSVPAIMATRALKSHFERIATIMVIPLFSCGARFPVYMLLIPAFFAPQYCSIAMFTIYIIGIIAAMLVARLLRSTTLRGEDSAFLIELPPYRIPRLRNVSSEVWRRSYGFIKKAGTVILVMSVILWGLSNFPEKTNYNRETIPAIGPKIKPAEIGDASRTFIVAPQIFTPKQEAYIDETPNSTPIISSL